MKKEKESAESVHLAPQGRIPWNLSSVNITSIILLGLNLSTCIIIVISVTISLFLVSGWPLFQSLEYFIKGL